MGRVRAILLAALCVPLVGCSGDPAEQAAVSTATQFVRQTDADTCTLLAPSTAKALRDKTGKDCAVALKDLALPRETTLVRAELAGEMAEVSFRQQTVFLAHFADGWRVRAAGCKRTDPDPAIPYECQVEP